jgi:hypothetical protein
MELEVSSVKTLIDKPSSLRDWSNLISWGMEPESLLPKNGVWIGFSNFQQRGGFHRLKRHLTRKVY